MCFKVSLTHLTLIVTVFLLRILSCYIINSVELHREIKIGSGLNFLYENVIRCVFLEDWSIFLIHNGIKKNIKLIRFMHVF